MNTIITDTTVKGAYPSFIPKISESECDGIRITVVYSPEKRPEKPFFICTEDVECEFVDVCSYINGSVFRAIEDVCGESGTKYGKEYAFYGKLIGPGIKSCEEKEYSWVIENIYDIKEGQYLDLFSKSDLCDILHLETV